MKTITNSKNELLNYYNKLLAAQEAQKKKEGTPYTSRVENPPGVCNTLWVPENSGNRTASINLNHTLYRFGNHISGANGNCSTPYEIIEIPSHFKCETKTERDETINMLSVIVCKKLNCQHTETERILHSGHLKIIIETINEIGECQINLEILNSMEKNLIAEKKEKDTIEKLTANLKKTVIFEKEFYFIKKCPAILKNQIKREDFGFVRFELKRTHSGDVWVEVGALRGELYKQLLPQEGAYKAQIYDRKNINFTYKFIGLADGFNCIDVNVLVLDNSEGERFTILVDPDLKEIERKLNRRFDHINLEELNDDVKVYYIYKYPARKRKEVPPEAGL